MPNASETTATAANTGDLASVRRAKRRSESRSRIFLYTARQGNGYVERGRSQCRSATPPFRRATPIPLRDGSHNLFADRNEAADMRRKRSGTAERPDLLGCSPRIVRDFGHGAAGFEMLADFLIPVFRGRP